ncbi:MAG TPA: type II secretion system F family protein [Thermodesulfobacteriota bacterium]|jgi:type IV pilus assembly protein PilC|nr:type II secretion system F family protein [Thermodesulfobacteriota bacterium]
MPVYKWEGKTAKGAVKKGEMEGPSEAAVRIHLRQQNIIPTKISSKGKEINISLPFKKKVKQKSVAIFTRQLATMIDAGLPLVQSLEILSSQQETKTFKDILRGIKEDVEGGSTFAGALKKHPATFNELYTNLVVAGEEGGILDNILNRLASYIEKSEALKKKVKSALVYPATIIAVAVIVVMILMIFVIPVFETMFKSAGNALPLPTLIVVTLSKMVKKYILIVIPALILFFYLFKKYYQTQNGKSVIDRIVLKLPVFGLLIRKIAVARFSRTLGTLVSSGVPILDGLTIVSRTAGNKTIENAILNARASIREGETIAEPLGRSSIFPPMVIQMISVGESTGALDSMLSKIAEFYEEEVDVAVANLTSLLEPLLMCFLGVVIGGVVIAMYLPIFNMASAVG